MFKIVLTFMILSLNYYISDAILRAHKLKDNEHNAFSARQMGRSIAQCFDSKEIRNCLESEIFDTLDKAIQSNETWQLNEFLVIEKNTQASSKDFEKLLNSSTSNQRQQRSLSDSLAVKMLQLAQSRSLKLQLPSSLNKLFEKRGRISSALDDFNAATDAGDSDGADAANGANPSTTLQQEEGRKKKDKDKNMAMMGGMAMMAMVAQMFMGKVILIAGSAFIMAKIALLVSVLGSVKKGSSGHSGSTEHVIVAGSGGGGGGGSSHEHNSGWHRSMPHDYNNNFQIVTPEEHKHTSEPVTYYELSQNDDFRRRQAKQTIN